MNHNHNHEPSNGFTFGDFFRSFIGWFIYLFAGPHSNAQSYTQINIEEGIHAIFSIVVAVTILLLSYIIRGILEDKQAWLTVQLDGVKNFLKFKKRNNKTADDIIDDIAS